MAPLVAKPRNNALQRRYSPPSRRLTRYKARQYTPTKIATGMRPSRDKKQTLVGPCVGLIQSTTALVTVWCQVKFYVRTTSQSDQAWARIAQVCDTKQQSFVLNSSVLLANTR